nr:uncharacterized protein LOC129387773 [Dermacentor andersoni]
MQLPADEPGEVMAQPGNKANGHCWEKTKMHGVIYKARSRNANSKVKSKQIRWRELRHTCVVFGRLFAFVWRALSAAVTATAAIMRGRLSPYVDRCREHRAAVVADSILRYMAVEEECSLHFGVTFVGGPSGTFEHGVLPGGPAEIRKRAQRVLIAFMRDTGLFYTW